MYIESFDLVINSVSMNNISGKVESICIYGDQNREVMEQLSVCTGIVNKLVIRNSDNCMDWLTADI